MKRTTGIAFLLALSAPPAASQQQPAAPALVRMSGVVVDSLRGGFLRGATVRVAGTSRLAFTDSLGRFALDSIPSGLREVELFHGLLDTLGIRVYAPGIAVGPDSTVTLALAVPSSRTIIRAKCLAASSDAGAVFGIVLDADSEEPVEGAQVHLTWMEISVTRETGVQYERNRREASTDADGRFKICYLPSDLAANISAARGRDSTSAVAVEYGESLLALTTLFLSRTAPDQMADAAPARGPVVTGTVVDSSGRPIQGARVSVASSAAVAETDSAGAFAVAGQRAGTQSLVVRRLGYQPAELIVHLTRRAPTALTVRLNRFVPVLKTVLVDARRGATLERVGFTRRRQETPGTFLMQADLDRRNAIRVADFLTLIPGLRRANALGESCVRYWVDGMRWQGEPDEFMSAYEVAAIEAYSSGFVPAEFESFDNCSVVVIWTKLKLGTR